MLRMATIKDHDMPRTLDLTALRSFVMVAEAGGVTRAAGLLNLTQSAVSMQIKRLEDLIGLTLLDRSGRGVGLTPSGEQLLGYARRMLTLNDEAWGRLTGPECAGELVLGVPHDIVYPGIARVMQAFVPAFPRVKVQLISSFTLKLKDQLRRGEVDIILTTEGGVEEGGEALATRPLVWVGAPGGQAWRQRPLRLAFEDACYFRKGVQQRLDQAGIPWEMAVESESTRSVEVMVSADLAVHTMIEGNEKRLFFEKVPHGGALPDLWNISINMYVGRRSPGPALDALAAEIRRNFSDGPPATVGSESVAVPLPGLAEAV
jgi:DNA-binding transcriptional LysR family regulator